MTEQTPGPWLIANQEPDKYGRVKIVDESFNVPCIAHALGRNGNALADARLIAAAPELLAACKAMLFGFSMEAEYGELDSAMLRIRAKASARAAIAKAEG